MNDRGDIVGYVRNAAGNSYDAFLWTRRRGYERIIDNPEGGTRTTSTIAERSPADVPF